MFLGVSQLECLAFNITLILQSRIGRWLCGGFYFMTAKLFDDKSFVIKSYRNKQYSDWNIFYVWTTWDTAIRNIIFLFDSSHLMAIKISKSSNRYIPNLARYHNSTLKHNKTNIISHDSIPYKSTSKWHCFSRCRHIIMMRMYNILVSSTWHLL